MEEELSNFQKRLKQLSVPYKKTEAYKLFVESQRYHKTNNASMFWNTDVGHVDKYQNVKTNNDGPIKKKIK